jgi:hypothetical protein
VVLVLTDYLIALTVNSSLITTLHLPDNIKLDQFISSHVLDVSKAGRTKDLELDSSSSESDVSEE